MFDLTGLVAGLIVGFVALAVGRFFLNVFN